MFKLIKSKQASQTATKPNYSKMDYLVPAVCHVNSSPIQWYPPLMLSADSLAEICLDSRYVTCALELLKTLERDDYTSYLIEYYQQGLNNFGAGWRYADIVTILLGLSETIKPENYLEIGVRRGRSVSAVASRSPQCNMYMFDMWLENYAGMENPGADLVSAELNKVGHTGIKEFYNGNSHKTLKAFFSKHPDKAFDLITVDGDHSFEGAIEDLCDVLPHLKIGGAVVFDDICHPKHMYLQDVWQKTVVDDPRYTAWTCKDIGYGVGFALRKW